jgi:hypothetical protein
MEEIVLYTLQPLGVWQKLQRDHVLYTDPSHPEHHPNHDQESGQRCPAFGPAYDWVRDQCAQRIEGYDPNLYPWWAWALYRGKERADLRHFAWQYSLGEENVRLTLRMPKDRVLLSDFSAYHFVLNGWYLGFGEADCKQFDKLWYNRVGGTVDTYDRDNGSTVMDYWPDLRKASPADREEYQAQITASWPRVFDIERFQTDPDVQEYISNGCTIQANFAELRLNEVVDVALFKGRRRK